VPRGDDWRERAACRKADPELFFPPKPRTAANYKRAKAICGVCPVRDKCLALVIGLDAADDRWGMFGGLTPSERRRMRSLYRTAHYGGCNGTQRGVRGEP